jgi:DNA processing protein
LDKLGWATLAGIAATRPKALKILKENGPEDTLGLFDKSEVDKVRRLAQKDIEATDIQLISQEDETYPPELFELDSPPACIFVKGKFPINTLRVAMVGTRKASPQGLGIARSFASDIARSGVTIVSGMADGIDSASHLGTVDAGGTTIAVLGCGLNKAKSGQQRIMAESITKDGAVISEYPSEFPGATWTFIARNRIIAALSKAVLVVEAPEKSGALITAKYALEMNHYVMACPGLPGMPSFAGSNKLIKDGALLVDSPNDVLSYIGATRLFDAPALTDLESKILLACSTPMPIDLICEKVDMPTEAVFAIITILDMRKMILKLPGGLYLKASLSNTKI